MKTIKLFTTLLLILGTLLLSVGALNAQKNDKQKQVGETTIKSKILNEDRVISVYLPDSYEQTTQKYPVMYLLDGPAHFRHATSAVDFLSRFGAIPEMIVVAIHNIDRSRDFSPVFDKNVPKSGGAEKFLAFVSEELIANINKKYRASDFNILMGHSFGGNFAVYSLLEKPEVFDAYIAVSPYLQFHDNYIVTEAKTKLRSDYKNHKYFYMTIGDEPDYFAPLTEFSDLINEKSTQVVDFKYVKMETENHATIPYLSVFNGLKYVFSDWQLKRETLQLGLSAIDDHFKQISNKYGYEVKTPENVINLLGYNYLQNNDFDNSIKIFAENIKRYPKSANVYDSMGEAYEKNNQLKLAEENYQKAFDIGTKQLDGNVMIYHNNLERVQKLLTEK